MTSKIKVDNINKVSDDSNIIKKCGTTTTIGSGASNPIVVDGSAVTIGRCGGTVALASGASQTGFGREGSVNWQTSIKTATFTAASGEGYFCNTSGGAFTVNLPSSPSVGDIVAIKDYASTFNAENLTIGRGGSNMNGNAGDTIRSTNNESLTLVYADATKGWLAVEEGTGFVGEAFMEATGGTITTSGNCKIHTFTSPGTFCVSQTATTAANNVVSYLVVAGGGSTNSSSPAPGGGGGGGYREVKNPATPYTASPLDGYPTPANRVTVTATSFPITVGAGGSVNGASSPSVFSTITSAGGGAGGGSPFAPPTTAGEDGGSGGGGQGGPGGCGGSGNTPPVSPSQGNNGGNGDPSPPNASGGGGGAGATGGTGTSAAAGGGGAGTSTQITASPVIYAVGGSGGGQGPTGDGPVATCGSGVNTDGAANKGNGAGANGRSGGSGIVVIRYKFQ